MIISLSIGLIFIDINHFFQIRRKVNTNDINLELVSKLKEKIEEANKNVLKLLDYVTFFPFDHINLKITRCAGSLKDLEVLQLAPNQNLNIKDLEGFYEYLNFLEDIDCYSDYYDSVKYFQIEDEVKEFYKEKKEAYYQKIPSYVFYKGSNLD